MIVRRESIINDNFQKPSISTWNIVFILKSRQKYNGTSQRETGLIVYLSKFHSIDISESSWSSHIQEEWIIRCRGRRHINVHEQYVWTMNELSRTELCELFISFVCHAFDNYFFPLTSVLLLCAGKGKVCNNIEIKKKKNRPWSLKRISLTRRDCSYSKGIFGAGTFFFIWISKKKKNQLPFL